MRTLVATEMMIMVMGMSGQKRKFDFLPSPSLLFFLFRPSPLSSCQAFPDPVSPFPSCHSMVATTLPVPPPWLVLPYSTLPPPYSTCHSAPALAQCLCPSSFHLERCPSLIAVSPGPRAPDTRNTNSQRFTACSKYTNNQLTAHHACQELFRCLTYLPTLVNWVQPICVWCI